MATPFAAQTLHEEKLRVRIELQETFLPPVFMEYINRKLIALKEKELATLDERTSEKRLRLERELATLQRELATLDEGAQGQREELGEDLRALHRAVHIEEEAHRAPKAPRKVYTKVEREKLFRARSQVMGRLLTDAQGGEIDIRTLAVALNSPESTVKDYYNDQMQLRPNDCFWQNGSDKAHFRWKDGYDPSIAQPSRVSDVVHRWHSPVS